ncbi:uncharacterized protein [Dasypus novemcinctus]|uniref:uncharacterized protein isoform X2 n=1 Tax=Dasypus novemcinctus TaxID=9361 RepID=UPI00265F9314|nr:uncharacterized protein LOC111766647 isoform X2 [Dasypus novemcinctus]
MGEKAKHPFLTAAARDLCETLLPVKGELLAQQLQYLEKEPLDGPLGEMNCSNNGSQDARASNASLESFTQLLCSENATSLKPETTSAGLSSLGTAVTAISGFVGIVALILLLVGLLSVTLKKWKHERLFKRQLRHQTKFLHKSSELSNHADAIYSNVINLAPCKEEDFAVYANIPYFDRPKKTSLDQVEYASIIFH